MVCRVGGKRRRSREKEQGEEQKEKQKKSRRRARKRAGRRAERKAEEEQKKSRRRAEEEQGKEPGEKQEEKQKKRGSWGGGNDGDENRKVVADTAKVAGTGVSTERFVTGMRGIALGQERDKHGPEGTAGCNCR